MSGTLGGVDASIPLRAGVGTGQAANQLTNNPLAFIDAMTRMRVLQLLPGELQLQQQELQKGGLGIQKSQAELNALKNNLVANGMMPLFAKGDRATLADATNTLGQLHAAGYDVDGITRMLAQSGETGGQGLLTVLKSAVMQAHPELGVPNMQPVNVGDQIIMQDVNPFTNPAIQTRSFTTGMTPEQRTQTQPTMVSTERGPQQMDIPKGSIYSRTGTYTGGQGAGGPAMIPTGNPAGTEQDINAYKAAQNRMPEDQRNLVAGTSALEALQLARTGPGTANVNRMKSFLIAQGFPGAEALDPNTTEAYQIARKNLLRFAQDAGTKVGTDLGLATKLEGNPNVDTLLNGANQHILKQDIGLARQRIAQTLTAPGAGGTGKTEFGTGMGAHVQNFTAKTDPVAFAWDLLSPSERKAHLDQIAKQEGGMAKWERSMQIARDTGMIKVPTQAQ